MYWIISFVFVIWRMYQFSTNRVTINKQVIKDKRISGLSYVHITDIHGKIKFTNGQLAHKINKINPNFVLVTGDLANNIRQYPRVFKALGTIKSPIYMVLGNYEYKNFVNNPFKKEIINFDMILDEVKKYKHIHLLMNEPMVYHHGNKEVQIYGFDQSQYGNEAFHIHKQTSMYRIVLAHSPYIMHYIRKHGIGFNHLLVGHTHGKQINLGKHVKFPYGHYHIGDKRLNSTMLFTINRGLGTSRIPLRINSQPEIRVYDIQ
ncbi:metallophosphoesterase family protein [Vallitalea pronyensis]|uniref:Metallophosphoesterase family protein n=1 Tax=Vallitalea pronyensis TaxID=1348613 RepID=A0A8J8MKS6_9FIRM|nr:metallophosphoesterase [Vallitalea pronyensis]QUI23118.1 metallophosphoesterase family protein [Vallitalea pronyensis]